MAMGPSGAQCPCGLISGNKLLLLGTVRYGHETRGTRNQLDRPAARDLVLGLQCNKRSAYIDRPPPPPRRRGGPILKRLHV
jgi:hypothetical protein